MNLKDKLSHLTFNKACKLLGPEGAKLIRKGGKWEIEDIEDQVKLDNKKFELDLGEAVVIIRLNPANNQRLHLSCSACSSYCEHQGAALSLILEEKLTLGLAAPPPETIPIENLSEEELIEQALAEKTEKAKNEKMRLKPANREELWSDYTITSYASGRTYRVALRGWERGQSYCSCPDFKVNTLGTCKHIIYALESVKKRFPKKVKETPYIRKGISLHIRYGKEAELRLLLPDNGGLDREAANILMPLKDKPIHDIHDLLERIRRVEQLGHNINIYPDAEDYINNLLIQQRVQKLTDEIRKDPKHHPLRKGLLNIELLPYQMDGIAFAVGTGRAVLADDMGLGKTIQGIGAAEMLAREVGISKVLVICPASVKSQWRLEIMRASMRECQLVLGKAEERSGQYSGNSFFTICNYEQVLRDIKAIEQVKWDLIILDEGQRIKNWEAKTTRVIKRLISPYALVLSGTPLENRLSELYSVVQFIDLRRLGPAFLFFHRHRVVNEKGRLLGYKNLDDLRNRLKPLLLRRTRSMVMKELPPRTTEILRIPPTEEQAEIDEAQRKIISTILSKKYLTEMDILRLQKALLIARMAADSTFLVDKEPPGYSTKLEEIDSLLERLMLEEERKIIFFSEWTTMLDLIEPLIEKRELSYVRLDGSVPQKKRQALVHKFQRDPDCKLFIATNAGATGLNLQAANTVINVDLPWNPAVLEQRIARAHRMGQKRPIQVYLLVTEGTIEESMLNTLSAKHELAIAALDINSKVSEVSFTGGIDELKRRLEILLGEKPEAAIDQSQREKVERETELRKRKENIAAAGGQLLSAAFTMIGELVGSASKIEGSYASQTLVGGETAQTFKNVLSDCMEKNEDGSMNLTIQLPDASALDNLAEVLAGIAMRASKKSPKV